MIQNNFLQGLLQLNFIPCEVVFFIVLFMAFNDAYEHDLVKKFTPPTVLLAILIIVDNVDYMMFDNMIEGPVHVLSAVVGYNVRIIILIKLIQLSMRKMHMKNRSLRFLLYVPELINLVVCLLAFNTRLVFWYEGGKTMRGPLAYVPHMVFVIYVSIMLMVAIRKLAHGKHNEGVFIISAVILSSLSVVVEMLFALRGILMGAIALDIFCYYLYFHIDHYKFDTLTEARNRENFEATIKKRTNIYAVFSIDMNGLKEVNDNVGHHFGDLALMATAQAIQDSLPRHCYLYRVGGDEFVVLVYNETVNLKRLYEKIHVNTLEAGCTVAIGYAYVREYYSFEKAYESADKMMYLDKKKMKKNNNVFEYSTNVNDSKVV